VRASGVLGALLLVGCVAPTDPADFFSLDAESPGHRAAQIRQFDTADELELLSASAAVLQDLGFQVEETASEVGYFRAAKERSAREYGQEILRFILALLGDQIPVDLHQKIAATLVARPIAADGTRHEVRIIFYRVVWKGDGNRSNAQGGSEYIPPGQQKMEMIRDAEIYQQFFARLSKAVFLEAHKI
jgi:hypothetical protein